MKKITIISLIVVALVLSGCNFPGSEGAQIDDPDDALATEIAKILTGTPVEAETSPTPDGDEVEPTEPAATNTPEPEEDPATPTPTASPTIAPTSTLTNTDPVLTLGAANWVDNMDNANNWYTPSDIYTTVAFSQGYMKLTAISSATGWRPSWPILEDFYLEVTLLSPECVSNANFGLMFRIPEDSNNNKGYLFGITCDGRYSLRRWDGTNMYHPVNLTAHNAINKGENVVNKLGVMARGSNLALYINGQKVNEINDGNYLTGKFGVFVGGSNVDNFTVWFVQIRYWIDP